MNRHLFLILLLFYSTLGLTQSRHKDIEWGDTCYPESAWAYGSFEIGVKAIGNVLPTHGIGFPMGINVARFFKKRYALGPMFNLRRNLNFGINRSYGRISPAVSENLIMNYDNYNDSTIATFLGSAFKRGKQRFVGNSLIEYGLFFSPFPRKYGGIMLQLKKSLYSFPIDGADKTELYNGDSDYIAINVPSKLTIQLTCKPFLFKRLSKSKMKNKEVRDHFLLSIFYERFSLNEASVYGNSLKTYLKQPFFDKYGVEHHFGFKIGVGIYQ